MQEIELKILLDEASEARLRRRAGQTGLVTGRASTADLRTVYFDTPDGRLAAAGIALRTRLNAGSWEQTVKTGRQARGGLNTTTEFTAKAETGLPELSLIAPGKIRNRIERLIGKAPLAPVYETAIRRTRREISPAAGARVELAIDQGEIIADTQRATLREAELELLEGPVAALFDVARALFPQGGLTFSTHSKADRARMLSREGQIVQPAAPRRASAVALTSELSVADGAGRVFGECLAQITANIELIGADDHPAGPHQARVGLRRLRAALALLAPTLNPAECRRLAGEARWLGAEIGQLRDLDVLALQILPAEMQAAAGEAGFDALSSALDKARQTERARLRDTLKGRRTHRFLIDLTERATIGADLNGTTLGELDCAPIEAALAKAIKRAGDIASLNIDGRHALRRALKRLRYMAAFLAPLHEPATARRFIKRIKRLQTLFGDLNDAAMAETVLATDTGTWVEDPAAMRAAGRIIGARLARADQTWSEAAPLWQRFIETPVFWR